MNRDVLTLLKAEIAQKQTELDALQAALNALTGQVKRRNRKQKVKLYARTEEHLKLKKAFLTGFGTTSTLTVEQVIRARKIPRQASNYPLITDLVKNGFLVVVDREGRSRKGAKGVKRYRLTTKGADAVK